MVADKPLPVSAFDGDSKTLGGSYRREIVGVFSGRGCGALDGMIGSHEKSIGKESNIGTAKTCCKRPDNCHESEFAVLPLNYRCITQFTYYRSSSSSWLSRDPCDGFFSDFFKIGSK